MLHRELDSHGVIAVRDNSTVRELDPPDLAEKIIVNAVDAFVFVGGQASV